MTGVSRTGARRELDRFTAVAAAAAVVVVTLAAAALASAGAAGSGRPSLDRGAAATTFPDAVLRPSYLSLDQPPGGGWQQVGTCDGVGGHPRATFGHGILSIDAPTTTFCEYHLAYPAGIWNRWVDNTRGWIVEAAVKIDPVSTGDCLHDTPAHWWIHDGTMLVIVGASATQVCLLYPDQVAVARPTSGGFHVYRVEARGRIVRVYVDGRKLIDHTFGGMGRGTRALAFGDGNGGSSAGRTHWDYVSYDTTPGFDPAQWQGSAWPTTARQTDGPRAVLPR